MRSAKTRSRPFVQFVHHAVQWVELPVAWWKNEYDFPSYLKLFLRKEDSGTPTLKMPGVEE